MSTEEMNGAEAAYAAAQAAAGGETASGGGELTDQNETVKRFLHAMEGVRSAVEPILDRRQAQATELTQADRLVIEADQKRYQELFGVLHQSDGRWQPEIQAIVDRLEEADRRGRFDPQGIRLSYLPPEQVDKLDNGVDDGGEGLDEREAMRAEIEQKIFPYIVDTLGLFAAPGEDVGPLQAELQAELYAVADRFMARAQDPAADNRYHWLGHAVYQVVTDTASHLRFLARRAAQGLSTQVVVEGATPAEPHRQVTIQAPKPAEVLGILFGALYHDIGYLPETEPEPTQPQSSAKRRIGHEAAGGKIVRERLLDRELALPADVDRTYIAGLAEAAAVATSFGPDNRTEEFAKAFAQLPDGLRGLVELVAIADLHGQVFDFNLLTRLPYLHEEFTVEDAEKRAKGDNVVGRTTVGMFNAVFERAVTTGEAPFPFSSVYAEQLNLLIDQGYRELAERYQIIDDFMTAAKGSQDQPSLIATFFERANEAGSDVP